MPTPTAPENTASAERSMPTAPSAMTIAMARSPMRMILTSSTCTDGVRSVVELIRLSAKLLAMLVAHSAMSSSAPALITSSGVSRRPPSTIAKESSRSIVASSWPRMESAATNHAVIDTSLTMKALRSTEVTSRIASQASPILAATIKR